MTSELPEPELFHLTAGAPVADGVRAVAKDQLDRALEAIDADDVDVHESVHEARKRCKKVRALLRLVRDDVPDTYEARNAELRDTARLVSAERDVGAHVETHDLLAASFGEDALAPYAAVRDQLVELRDGPVEERITDRLGEVRERLATVRWQVDGWELPEGDAVDVLRDGYERTYRRARERWRDALDEPTSHGWHEWRKRVKYNRYHTNLLQQAWPPVMELREELLHDLTDDLGDDNDLWELRRAATGEDERVDGGPKVDVDETTTTGYVGLVDALRTRRQHSALRLAARCYGQPVDEHVDMVLAWWQHAVDERRGAALDADDLDPVIRPGD